MAEFEFPLKDYLNGINLKMGKLEDNERAMKKYPKYVVNKMLSSHMDCIIHVNEMNRYYNLDNALQYHYFLYSICLLYTSPSPRDRTRSRMPSSA